MARIGVMTGGGDCPGLNAVIRAVVKRALQSGHEVIGIEDAFHGLFRERGTYPLNLEAISGILPKGGTILGTSNRSNPFRFPVKDGGVWVERDVSDAVMRRFSEIGIEGLVCIGGDGSMSISQRMMVEKGLKVIGVPKTIDNDLAGTDQTFGFDTARGIVTDAIDKLHTTAEAHDRVMIVEVMGRQSGFIALEAGIAGGADIILLPEIPYRIEPVVEAIRRRMARGRTFSIAVVAEGAFPEGGAVSVEAAEMVGRGVVKLGGAGRVLAESIADKVDLEVRVTVLGHLQRGGGPSAYDRLLGTRLGAHAVTLVNKGEWGRVVVLKGFDIADVPLTDAVTRPRLVDPNGQMAWAARQLGICLGEKSPP